MFQNLFISIKNFHMHYLSSCPLSEIILHFPDMNAMDPFTFISAMMTLMASDASAAMQIMMAMNGGQLPQHVADVC